ncbi:MAG: YifB family Mg chelatase-like AAA ATPase [Patescibacteria group bacterium]|nr:YifB family Mg chelatase-like AAA ATPase [Patescibacteria group bacterium]
MLAKVYSAQVVGLKADLIDLEVDIARGLHSFSIVGLPDKAVEEAKDRISAAIKNSGFKSPQKSNKKVIVGLAPADLKKEGPVFDLAIALAYLLAGQELKFESEGKLFIGELALDGSLRAIKGPLMMVRRAQEAGFTEVYLPSGNAREAALVPGIKVYACNHLRDIADHLSPPPKAALEKGTVKKRGQPLTFQPPTKITHQANTQATYDLSEIKGQQTAKRGLEIAAAGGHNLAMSGPPGTGKTMLAKAFAGLLPPLDFEAVLEVTGIHSASGLINNDLITEAPFRAPHHTASYISLVGGGAWPKPGEITLAHRGILFLDEFPEFDKRVIEALRQPLEDRVVRVSRARGSMTFPANFILIAAMNPCPCGNKGLRTKECICSQAALVRYGRKLSGPIVDRIDLWLEVPQVDHERLAASVVPAPTLRSGQTRFVGGFEESSSTVRKRILEARRRQTQRFAAVGKEIHTNSDMGPKELRLFAPLNDKCAQLLTSSAKRLDLSARAYHRTIKLARTIADLAGSEHITEQHLTEALQYRPKIQP